MTKHVIGAHTARHILRQGFLDREPRTATAGQPLEPVDIDAQPLRTEIIEGRREIGTIEFLVDGRPEPRTV